MKIMIAVENTSIIISINADKSNDEEAKFTMTRKPVIETAIQIMLHSGIFFINPNTPAMPVNRAINPLNAIPE